MVIVFPLFIQLFSLIDHERLNNLPAAINFVGAHLRVQRMFAFVNTASAVLIDC